MFFKKRTSILEPWSEKEASERAQDYYGHMYSQTLKARQQLPDEILVSTAAGFCCTDAMKKLRDSEFVQIAGQREAWQIVATNWERVARSLLFLFEGASLVVGDKDMVIEEKRQSI